MKIFIPFQVRDIGGPSSFVKKFQTGMESRGHIVTLQEDHGYDLVLVIVQAPFMLLWRARRLKKPIVQRLDGVYYWSVAGWRFPLLNLKAMLVRHFFADYTIYQSSYSQQSVNRFLGCKAQERSSVIYNGVAIDHFSPAGEKKNLRDFPGQQIFFTASEFRRENQIVPLLNALQKYHENFCQNFKFIIAGSFTRELAGFEVKLSKYPWVQFLGKIRNEDLPSYERGADVFLFAHPNSACPNNVIEAISCGLPVCGVNDGAMSELILPGINGRLVQTEGEAYWHARKYDSAEFARDLDSLMEHHQEYTTINRERAVKYFSLDHMLNQYEIIFRKIL